MSLREKVKRIQLVVGVTADGIFGPITAEAVERALVETGSAGEAETGGTPVLPSAEIDPRSAKVFAGLEDAIRPNFERFSRLANATAAAMGCDYVAISGHRSWEDQTKLYAKGRTAPGPKVTSARAGYSWHNFGLAVDFGVFRGKRYLDSEDPLLARRVHVACSAHAAACGLSWGGNWKSFKDIPHYQVAGFPSTPTSAHRKSYKANGTVMA